MSQKEKKRERGKTLLIVAILVSECTFIRPSTCVAGCEMPLEHYTIAAKYTREEFIEENQKECEDKCKTPDCGRFEFTTEKKVKSNQVFTM